MNLSNFFAKQKLSRALMIAFADLVGVMIILGSVSFFTLGKVGQQLDTEFTKDIKPSIQILEAEIAFNKAEAALYRYILANDNDTRKAALNRFNLSMEKVKENLGLAEKKMLSEKTKAAMATVQKDLKIFIEEAETIKEYVDRGRSSVAANEVASKQFRSAVNELDKAVQEIVHVKEENIEKALVDAKQETFYGEMIIVVLILVGVGVSVIVSTSISKGLNATSGEVRSAIELVAKNDLTKEVPNIHLNNEIGDMAKA
jgi:CHASE3 domain sensor protein